MSESPGDQVHELPEHDIRQQAAVADGEPLVAYRSLDAARQDAESTVVLSGDYGGTIFLTIPVRLLRTAMSTLCTLASDLDAITWMSGSPGVEMVALERHPVGDRVSGGDGGGRVVEGVWTHPHALPAPAAAQAAEVILGSRERVDADLLRVGRQRELERKRAWRATQKPLPRNLPWDFDIRPAAEPFE